MVDLLRQRQRLIDNDDPEAIQGRKFGYVREGDTWYPATIESKEHDTGILAGTNKMVMRYGTTMLWVPDGEGNYKPEFLDAKTREFEVEDDVLTKGGTGKDYNDKYNTTRDWYWMDSDEAKSMINGEQSFVPIPDDTPKNAYTKQLNDWRLALGVGRDYKSLPGRTSLNDDAYEDAYGGLARGLSRIVTENRSTIGVYNVAPGEPGWENAVGYLPALGKEGTAYAEELAKGDSFSSRAFPMNDYLMHTVLQTHLDALYRTQSTASTEAGFDRYNTENLASGSEWADTVPPENRGHLLDRHPTAWSTLYLDTGKDLSIAQDAQELEEQIHTIEQYTDRTQAQRSYLVQKASTRYWMNQIATLGGTNELNEFLFDNTETAQRYAGPGFTGAWVMPWQNAGEGMMPDLFYDDQVSDYWQDQYATRSADALTNTRRFIGDGVDPNNLLNGFEMPMGSGTVLSPEHAEIDDMIWDPNWEGGTYVTREEWLASREGTGEVGTLTEDDGKTVTWDDQTYWKPFDKDEAPDQVEAAGEYTEEQQANWDATMAYFDDTPPDVVDVVSAPDAPFGYRADGVTPRIMPKHEPHHPEHHEHHPHVEDAPLVPDATEALQDHHFDPPFEAEAFEPETDYVEETPAIQAMIHDLEHPTPVAPVIPSWVKTV